MATSFPQCGRALLKQETLPIIPTPQRAQALQMWGPTDASVPQRGSLTPFITQRSDRGWSRLTSRGICSLSSCVAAGMCPGQPDPLVAVS